MEPFGLFSFLRSFLDSSPSFAPQEEETPPPEADASQAAKANVSPQENEPNSTPAQDAVLHFLSAHESRANRSKKKR